MPKNEISTGNSNTAPDLTDEDECKFKNTELTWSEKRVSTNICKKI